MGGLTLSLAKTYKCLFLTMQGSLTSKTSIQNDDDMFHQALCFIRNQLQGGQFGVTVGKWPPISTSLVCAVAIV